MFIADPGLRSACKWDPALCHVHRQRGPGLRLACKWDPAPLSTMRIVQELFSISRSVAKLKKPLPEPSPAPPLLPAPAYGFC